MPCGETFVPGGACGEDRCVPGGAVGSCVIGRACSGTGWRSCVMGGRVASLCAGLLGVCREGTCVEGVGTCVVGVGVCAEGVCALSVAGTHKPKETKQSVRLRRRRRIKRILIRTKTP